MPLVAFGTGTAWFVGSNDETAPLNQQLLDIVKQAIQLGYTHIDCAERYGTEREVGEAIIQSGRPRSQLFITTKIWHTSVAEVKGVALASLKRLKVDYVDLLLLHSPFFQQPLPEVWRCMEELVKLGVTRDIGVSNFRVSDLSQLSGASIPPCVNQVELHPYCQNEVLREWSGKHKMVTMAYGPLVPITKKMDGPIHAVLTAIAAKHKVTPTQVLLKWNISHALQGFVTTSSKRDRLVEYLSALSVNLSEDELAQIDKEGARLYYRQFWTDKDFQDKPATL